MVGGFRLSSLAMLEYSLPVSFAVFSLHASSMWPLQCLPQAGDLRAQVVIRFQKVQQCISPAAACHTLPGSATAVLGRSRCPTTRLALQHCCPGNAVLSSTCSSAHAVLPGLCRAPSLGCSLMWPRAWRSSTPMASSMGSCGQVRSLQACPDTATSCEPSIARRPWYVFRCHDRLWLPPLRLLWAQPLVPAS
jgi:hypothetical protein